MSTADKITDLLLKPQHQSPSFSHWISFSLPFFGGAVAMAWVHGWVWGEIWKFESSSSSSSLTINYLRTHVSIYGIVIKCVEVLLS